MRLPLFIDFSYKDGIHEHLMLARKRDLIYPLYKKWTKIEKLHFFRPLLFFQKKMNIWLPVKYRWGEWKNNLQNHSDVVITASYHTIPVVKYIHDKYPQIKINVFYFNTIKNDVPLSYFQKFKCKIWSFDEDDCKRYNLNYNSQVVVKENYYLVEDNSDIDVLFIGADKGRLNDLLKIKRIFVDLGFSTYFHVVSTFNEDLTQFDYKEYLKYNEIVKLVSQSKAILEYVQDGQVGQTIRPLEAIYMNKKLITNNFNLEKESYYNKDRFFIIGKDNINDFEFFLNKSINVDIKQNSYYEIENWLKRFL